MRYAGRDPPASAGYLKRADDPPMTDQAINRRRLLLACGAGAVGLAAYRIAVPAADYDGAALTAAQAHEQAKTGEIILVDIRRPDEWRLTGIGEGAHAIDMRRDDFLTALTDIAGPDKAAPIALICARGVRSARLSQQLTDAGFTRIIDVPEGMLGSGAGPGWLAAGLPVESYSGPSG